MPHSQQEHQMRTTSNRLPDLASEMFAMDYEYGLVMVTALYVARYDTLSGCPWVAKEDLPRLRAVIGERIPKDFTPEPVAFRVWCMRWGIMSADRN